MRCLWVLLLAGCTHTENAVVDPSASPAATVTAADVELVAHALTLQERGESPATTLGASCRGTALCGTRGRVALRADARQARPATEPCTRTEVPGSGGNQPGMKMYRVDACVAGDRLYLRQTCLVCRTMSVDDVEAIVTDLTGAQREHLRGRMGLAAKADLDSASDWKDAIAATAP